MSNYVVIARFDREWDEKFARLKAKLVERGFVIHDWPFHFTMAAYEHVAVEDICAWTREFASTHGKIAVEANAWGILPPSKRFPDTAVLYLMPAHQQAFVDFYYDFHQRYEEYCTGIGEWNSTTRGDPLVHGTIGILPKDDLQTALKIAFESDLCGTAHIEALEVYGYPMKLIERVELA